MVKGSATMKTQEEIKKEIDWIKWQLEDSKNITDINLQDKAKRACIEQMQTLNWVLGYYDHH